MGQDASTDVLVRLAVLETQVAELKAAIDRLRQRSTQLLFVSIGGVLSAVIGGATTVLGAYIR